MRLSAFSILDEYPDLVARGRDRFQEIVALAREADRSQLGAVWVAEHHFHSGGVCPSPPVLLAALGARTKRIRLGAMVSVLPFHDPVHVAEEYAMVDRLSGGRLNLGLGSGYIPTELEGFGIDPATKRERFDAAFDTLRSALLGEPVRTTAPNAPWVTTNVRPTQRPHPPLWIAAQRREALPFIARRNVSVALIPYATVPDLPTLASEIREYRSHLPEGSPAEVAVALHLYAGDRPTAARRALQRYLDSRLATQSAFYQQRVREDPRLANAGAIEEAGFALFGSAESVRERLKPFASAGVDEVLGIFDFGGIAPTRARSSVRSLGALGPV
ncbi:MAG: LLM class flavin-dependent oxidoreductase [Thermoplasmata archaeon]|nr:LLM class flavin-dependent oxidoreductase [Thermoplasmata archaeon]